MNIEGGVFKNFEDVNSSRKYDNSTNYYYHYNESVLRANCGQ